MGDLLLVLVPWMAVAPGACLAFGIPGRLDPASRWALSAVLSPLVVSVLFCAAIRAGVDAAHAAFGLAVLGVPGAWLGLRASTLRRAPVARSARLATSLVAGVAALWLVIHWLGIPGYRLFGFHNLMHADIVYEILRSVGAPEEPELAGLPLAYTWLPHAFWAAIATLVDAPPTRLHPLTNGVLLVATVSLVVRSARGLGLPVWASMLGGLLALLSGHWAVDLSRLAGMTTVELYEHFGGLQLKAPIVKFSVVGGMPISIALVAAWLRLAVALHERADRGLFALLGATLLAGVSLYPICAPTAVGLFGALAACELWRGDRRAAARLGVGCGLAVATLAVGSSWTTGVRGDGVVSLSAAAEAADKLGEATLALAPYLVLAVPGTLHAWRRREALVLGLVLVVIGHLLVYAVFSVRHLEYKFVMYLRPFLAVAVAASLAAPWLRLRRRRAVAVLLAVVVPVTGLSASLIRVRAGGPKARGLPAIDESSLQLSLDASEPHAAWTDAVRERTPSDAILVAAGLDLHAGIFANRSLYYPCELNGMRSPGYGLPNAQNLVRFRGHSREVVRRRRREVLSIFEARSVGELRDALARLQLHGRPLALLVPAVGSRAAERLDWLSSIAPDGRIHREPRLAVWLLEPGERR